MVRSLVFTLSATALFVLYQPSAAQPAADFSGVWVLDSAASDTLPGIPAEKTSRSARIGIRVGPPFSRFPQPYARSIYDPERMREALAAIGQRPGRLFIAVTDTVVTISRDGEPPFSVWPDGRKVETRLAHRLDADVEARWDDGGLRIERTLASGLEVTETYELETADRLVVRIEARGPIPRAIDLRWRYDRSETASSSSTASKSSM